MNWELDNRHCSNLEGKEAEVKLVEPQTPVDRQDTLEHKNNQTNNGQNIFRFGEKQRQTVLVFTLL